MFRCATTSLSAAVLAKSRPSRRVSSVPRSDRAVVTTAAHGHEELQHQQQRRVVLAGLGASLSTLAMPPTLDAQAAAALTVPPGRLLKNSGITPSAVIKGCWQLSGGHGGERESDRTSGASAVEDFRAFVDAGITTFDTGPEECGYGPSEALVGQFLRTGYGGAAVQVNSKLCCVGGEQRAFTTAWAEGKVDRTLARLGRPSMGLMQLYWRAPRRLTTPSRAAMCRPLPLNDYDAPAYVDAALALQDLKQRGKISGVAYTNFDTERLERIGAAGAELAANQIQYSLLDRRPELKMNAFCRSSGMRLLPYGVLAGGFLSDRYLNLPVERVQLTTSSQRKYASVLQLAGGWTWFQELLAVLRGVGDAHGGQPISNVAARWVLQKDTVAGVILGARNATHVADHVRLFDFELTAGDLEAIEAVLAKGKQSRGDCYAYERGGVW